MRLVKPSFALSSSLFRNQISNRLGHLNVRNLVSKASKVEVPEGSGLEHQILFYALKQASPVTLREMLQFGTSAGQNPNSFILIAQFLHNELPIRLAHRVRELKRLPAPFLHTTSINGVVQLYENSFMRIRNFPVPKTIEGETKFVELLANIKERHAQVQQSISQGIQEVNAKSKDQVEKFELGTFLDRFYMSRISIRMLIGQHVELHNPREGWVGIIQTECFPVEVAQDAIDNATHVCMNHYGMAPKVNLLGETKLSLSYVPSHLYYIIFELLKNSMRAVVEFHGNKRDLPKIDVIIAEGDEDISIKISDRGGGIPRSGMNRIWSYSYTTATKTENDITPMAGFGHGLPLSRLYARYFGGDLQIISMQGFGTDAYVHISKLDIDEQLP